jgi:thiamine biosynthesis lipoprotein
MRLKAAAALAAFSFLQCQEPVKSHKWFAMDTNMAVYLYGHPRTEEAAIYAALEAETERLANLFTDFSPNSALSAIKGKADDTVDVDPEVYGVLRLALETGEAGNGAFDITLHDLKWLWGLSAGQDGHVPSPASLDSLMGSNPMYHAGLDPGAYRPPVTLIGGNRAVLHRTDTQLDLGAIAKGHIVDRLHRMLDSLGAPDHILQAGGEIRLGGRKSSGPWLVGIRDPRSADTLSGMITTKDPKAVSTSGDYERFFIQDGVRYHHIFDPRTGSPAKGIRAVTVMADSSGLSEALSTSLFVLGPERGAPLARRYHAAAVWYKPAGDGLCAVVMPEFSRALELKGVSPCPAP